MTDIVERLRERAARKWTDAANRSASLFGEAADEIERLRDELAICCALKRDYQSREVEAIAKINTLRADAERKACEAPCAKDERNGVQGTHSAEVLQNFVLLRKLWRGQA